MKKFNVFLIFVLLYFLCIDVNVQGDALEQDGDEWREYPISIKTDIVLGVIFIVYVGDVEMRSTLEITLEETETSEKKNIRVRTWYERKKTAENTMKKYSSLGIKVGATIDVEEIKDYLKKRLKKDFPYFEWK